MRLVLLITVGAVNLRLAILILAPPLGDLAGRQQALDLRKRAFVIAQLAEHPARKIFCVPKALLSSGPLRCRHYRLLHAESFGGYRRCLRPRLVFGEESLAVPYDITSVSIPE